VSSSKSTLWLWPSPRGFALMQVKQEMLLGWLLVVVADHISLCIFWAHCTTYRFAAISAFTEMQTAPPVTIWLLTREARNEIYVPRVWHFADHPWEVSCFSRFHEMSIAPGIHVIIMLSNFSRKFSWKRQCNLMAIGCLWRCDQLGWPLFRWNFGNY